MLVSINYSETRGQIIIPYSLLKWINYNDTVELKPTIYKRTKFTNY